VGVVGRPGKTETARSYGYNVVWGGTTTGKLGLVGDASGGQPRLPEALEQDERDDHRADGQQ
jgi:hypothetical protein